MVLDMIYFTNVVEPLCKSVFFFFSKMLKLVDKGNIVLPKQGDYQA